MDLYKDAKEIIENALIQVRPEKAVRMAMGTLDLQGRVYLIAVGKAAWVMAKTAAECLGEQMEKGVLVTKYGHCWGMLDRFEIIEAGHPTPDENSVEGAKKAINLASEATEQDTVLFLISGGGSSLCALPADGLTLADIQKVTRQLLFCGANITEMNVIRKKLSAVKGGKIACGLKAKACSIILSDIIGDHEDMIASGLTYPDASTAEDALRIVDKYGLKLDEKVEKVLRESSPCREVFVENHVVGSVSELCRAAAAQAEKLGYHSHILSVDLQCEAREAGKWLASFAEADYERPFAVVAGGETVVKITGDGLGGRNQELALAAAKELVGKENVLLFSLGSDGTDGPTDAAGGIVDGTTAGRLEALGIHVEEVLARNDSYHALKAVDGLLITGATGTNVNDVSVLLCR